MTTSWVYEISVVEGDFEARGLAEATRVAVRLNEVLREALERDHEVISATEIVLRIKGSKRNYLQPE